MEAVCWLGLLGSGLFSTQESKADEAMAAAMSPWLSEREKWVRNVRARKSKNSLGWLDTMSACSAASCGKAKTVAGFESDPGIGLDPAFADVLLESLKIRTSNLPPCEKGRQLVRLIKPWMTFGEVHALFGESEAVLRAVRGDGSWPCVVYLAYGVMLQWHYGNGFPVLPWHASGEGTARGFHAISPPETGKQQSVWEWLAAFEKERQDEQKKQAEHPFFMYGGFSTPR